MADATPLGRDQGLLESTAQSYMDGEQSSSGALGLEEERVRQPSNVQVRYHATPCPPKGVKAAVPSCLTVFSLTSEVCNIGKGRAVTQEAYMLPFRLSVIRCWLQGRRSIQRNGLLQGGDSGTFRHWGRGLSASVSFSSSRSPSNPLPSNQLNGSAAARAAPVSNGAQPAAGSGTAAEQVVGGLSLGRKAQEMDNLSVLCALRQSCVMLTPETSLTEALEVRRANAWSCLRICKHVIPLNCTITLPFRTAEMCSHWHGSVYRPRMLLAGDG